MSVRVLILSLCLSAWLYATPIVAPPPDPGVATSPEEPPVFQLNLSNLLSLVLQYSYPDLEDPDVQGNVLTVITPLYEAFLNAYLMRTASPAGETTTALTTAITPPLDLGGAGSGPGGSVNVAVPEPSTWMLLAAGGAAIAYRRRPNRLERKSRISLR